MSALLTVRKSMRLWLLRCISFFVDLVDRPLSYSMVPTRYDLTSGGRVGTTIVGFIMIMSGLLTSNHVRADFPLRLPTSWELNSNGAFHPEGPFFPTPEDATLPDVQRIFPAATLISCTSPTQVFPDFFTVVCAYNGAANGPIFHDGAIGEGSCPPGSGENFFFGPPTILATCATCSDGFLQANGTCSGGKNNGGCTGTIGNPCNPANGNKVQREVVYRGLNGFGLSVTFNTFDDITARFGRHWRDSFNREVLADGNNVVVYRPDGKALLFVPVGGTWVTDADTSDRLVEIQNPLGTRTGWQLFVADGDELESYDAAGKLITIQSRSGLTQTLTYSDGTSGFVLDANGTPTTQLLPAGLLLRATDNFGRPIVFGYDAISRVVSLTDPAAGAYRFSYDTFQNLASIGFPDGSVRDFLYNEPGNIAVGASFPDALTGIIDENGNLFANFTYDAQQRALSTEHASVERYTMSYGSGSTTVTDPLGTSRVYSFQTTLGVFKNTDRVRVPRSEVASVRRLIEYAPR